MTGDEYELPGGIKVRPLDSYNGIEIGSIVVCDSVQFKGANIRHITKGNSYEVVGLYKVEYKTNGEEGLLFDGEVIIQVSDDGKFINGFPSSMFTPLDIMRNDKIKKVIE